MSVAFGSEAGPRLKLEESIALILPLRAFVPLCLPSPFITHQSPIIILPTLPPPVPEKRLEKLHPLYISRRNPISYSAFDPA